MKMREHEGISVALDQWILSLQSKYRMSDDWNARLDRLRKRAQRAPEKLTAADVGRVFHAFERHRIVSDATPLADAAIQHLLDLGQVGSIDTLRPELKNWFDRHYLLPLSLAAPPR